MRKRYLLLLSFCLTHLIPSAQNGSYLHEVIGTREGLQSSKIYALQQDKERQLWIGTELGISIFNGYEFRNIQYSSEKALIGRVLAIVCDRFGRTWIGGDNGLFYASESGIKQVSVQGRSSMAIEALVIDGENNLWIGEVSGLYKMNVGNIRKGKEAAVNPIRASKYANFSQRVFALHTDAHGNIYVAGFNGVFLFRKNKTLPETVWSNPEPFNYVRSVAAFSPDSVYWNCYDSPPMKKINGVLTALPDARFAGRNVFIHGNKPYALTTSGIAAIDGPIIRPIISFENLSNHVPAALIDAEGNFWLGSWEGLIKFRRTGFRQYNLLHPRNIDAFSLLETKSGDLLIGGNRGRVFLKKGDSIVPHRSFPLMFEKAELMSMYEHSDGSFWFGSGYQGITRYKKNQIRNWNGRNDELQNNNCEAIFDAGNGKLFACTEKGVTVINPAVENAIEGYIDYKKTYTLYPELFGGILINGSWTFYGSKGLYRLKNGLLEDDSIAGLPFASVYINKIVKDKGGFYWIATLGHGLLKCRVSQNGLAMFKQFNKAKGLSSDDILSVLVDKNNDVWCADYMSLSVVRNNSNDDEVVVYNEKDGLLRSYYQTFNLQQQKNGTVWGLTTMGTIAFHPDSLANNSFAPLLKLAQALVNENDAGSRRLISGEKFPSLLSLSHSENSIRFSFTANSLTDPSKIRYAYRLMGQDSTWTITSARTINFNFLPPAKYVFELKASNNNNVWTPLPIRLAFTVRPPFWRTWWFLSLCALASASVVYLVFRSRVRRVKEKAAISQQLAELEGKALRAQMNPHFIFNSLNAIQELIVMQKVDAAYEYLARFSKLLRMVLHNSEKNLVVLEEELEMIQIYLDLESLRFKNSFDYTIVIDDNIDAEEIDVPPLLLQPFIENAIWHGLRNKPGDKKLSIRCSSKDNGVLCIIEDNGIGREKAGAIKASKMGAAGFASRGMILSEQRMALMNFGQDTKFRLEVEDLRDQQGDASGTRVVLHLPHTND